MTPGPSMEANRPSGLPCPAMPLAASSPAGELTECLWLLGDGGRSPRFKLEDVRLADDVASQAQLFPCGAEPTYHRHEGVHGLLCRRVVPGGRRLRITGVQQGSGELPTLDLRQVAVDLLAQERHQRVKHRHHVFQQHQQGCRSP